MNLDFGVVWQYWPFLLEGAWLTLQLAVLGSLLGLVLGFVAALGKLSSYPLLAAPANFYVWFIRGTPLLVQLFIIYYGLPQLGVQITAYTAAVLGLGINGGAYMAESYRASILAIPKGQTEAALSLGMTPWQAMRLIVMPQALRIAIPSLGNQAIILLKDSSLASVIALAELLMVAKRYGSRHFTFLEFFLIAALIYLGLTTLFNVVINGAERWLSADLVKDNSGRKATRLWARLAAPSAGEAGQR
ncbi:MAG: amino acid ABC transporter permease [Limnochordales bacterium]